MASPIILPTCGLLETASVSTPSAALRSSKSDQHSLVSVNSDNMVNQHRICETGIISRFAPQDFIVSFESEPFWLLSLSPRFVRRIYLDNPISSLNELHSYLSLSPRLNIFNKIVSHLGLHRFAFHFELSSLPSNTIVLISGTPEFFQLAVSRHHEFRALFVYTNYHFPAYRFDG